MQKNIFHLYEEDKLSHVNICMNSMNMNYPN